MPGAAVRHDQGLSARLPDLYQCDCDAAARRIGIGPRPGLAAGGGAGRVEGAAQPSRHARAGDCRRGCLRQFPHRRRGRYRPLPGAPLASPRRWPVHWGGQHCRYARPRHPLGQRVDLPCPGARPRPGDDPVRSRGTACRDHRPTLVGAWPALSGCDSSRARSGAVCGRLRVSARGGLGIRLRRRQLGAARSRWSPAR
jgi:hypothetical protein